MSEGRSGSGEMALFAVAAPGLEPLVAAELAALGIEGEAEAGGVAWQGDEAQLIVANLHLRVASRVLVRVAEFRARTFFELERHARRIPWDRYLPQGAAVGWRVTSKKSKLYHQGAVAQRLQEAAAAAVGAVAAAGAADDEEEGSAEGQSFIVRALHDRFTISADSSGELLHRRGYRQATARAPLRETLAAAMLRATGYDPAFPLLDPMCGAGTIPIEAALLARRIAPGLARADRSPRPYAFRHWPAADDRAWNDAVSWAREAILPAAPGPIIGSDRDAGAIEAATSNAERAGVAGDLELRLQPLSAMQAPAGPGWLITNPPYGVRVGENDRLRDLYAALGRTARQQLPGWTVAMLSADRRLEGQTGLRLEERVATRNGGIPVRIVVGRVPG